MKFISWFVCHNTTNNPRDHEARSWNAADNALSNCSLIYFSFKHLESLSLNSDTCLATHSSSLIIASTCCCCCCFREVISELNLVFVVGWISRFYFNRALKINIFFAWFHMPPSKRDYRLQRQLEFHHESRRIIISCI